MSFNWDPMGKVIIEARADAAVVAIVGANPTESPARVRPMEPNASDIHAGNATDPYRAFVVISSLGGRRERRVPVQRPRFVAKCYGRDKAEASKLAAAMSDAFHFKGPRVHSNDLGIYASFTDEEGAQDKDPVTQQPYVTTFIDLIATTQAAA